MGSHGYSVARGRESVLRRILKEDYKYVIGLVCDNPEGGNELIEGGYQVFKELNEEEMKRYAIEEAKMYNLNLRKVNVYSLENKVVRELKP